VYTEPPLSAPAAGDELIPMRVSDPGAEQQPLETGERSVLMLKQRDQTKW